MSFDLAVWRPGLQEVTAEEASRYYTELCSRPYQSFIPSPEMESFVDSVTERYRSAHAMDEALWAAKPDIAEGCAIMPIRSGLAADVFPIIRDLARERGLVLFDPQDLTVYYPRHDEDDCQA
jgi:hypothetical protein